MGQARKPAPFLRLWDLGTCNCIPGCAKRRDMIRSMTGFGSGSASSPQGEVAVEIKSLNNRFLDLNLKLPRELHFVEPRLREEIKRRLRRGKVDVFVRWTPSADAQPLYEINKSLLRRYATEVREALDSDIIDPGSLLTLPGVVSPTSAATESGPLGDAAAEALSAALSRLEQVRTDEGGELARAIATHLEHVEHHRREIDEIKGTLLDEYRKRLKERMDALGKTLDTTLDAGRAEAEIMFFAEKSDITEELVRLDAHLKSFRSMLQGRNNGEPMGKNMDFLVQELLRETNTIGNKARGVAVAQRIVQMKSEIEKVREQVQNLE